MFIHRNQFIVTVKKSFQLVERAAMPRRKLNVTLYSCNTDLEELTGDPIGQLSEIKTHQMQVQWAYKQFLSSPKGRGLEPYLGQFEGIFRHMTTLSCTNRHEKIRDFREYIPLQFQNITQVLIEHSIFLIFLT